jgi:hypothetical protein
MSHSQPPYPGNGPYGQQPQPGQPPQGYYQPPPQPPKRKRHIARNILIGVAALVVLIIALGAVASKGKTPSPAASPAAPAATSPASASPAAVAAPPPAPPRVLIRFDGSGIRNSPPFNVGSGALTVHYSFDCAAFGSSGNFVADLLYGNQSSFSSDDQPIANALAASGSTTTTVYPQDPGRDYYLSVDSECSWKIKVTG